jgi:hypothetical protein
MANSSGDDNEQRDLRKLIEQIKSESGCVLVLGPRVAVRADDAQRRPLDEILAGRILYGLTEATSETSLGLRHAADLHFRHHKDRQDLQLWVRDFYTDETKSSTTPFHRHLADLPFRLCISTSPDSLMLNAFESVGKHPRKSYYDFQPQPSSKKPVLTVPTVDQPLVYYLFGHHEDSASLVLTEADLIDYLVKIIKADPAIPVQVRSILKDESASFLFLGFGFQNWYLRVLLKVLDVYGHRFKSVAFEDPQFLNARENKHAIAFFEDRFIEFRHLRWEPFAEQLRQTYLESLPPPQTEPTRSPMASDPSAPCAFLSYAGKDSEAVEKLAAELQVRGIRIWQDKQNLRAGDNWSEVLLSVIEDTEKVHYVIVVMTPAMITAERGVFNREIDAAQKVQKDMGQFKGQKLRFVIPVTLGRNPLLSLLLLSSLKDLHTIDVSESVGVDQLAKSINEDWETRKQLKQLNEFGLEALQREDA